MTQPFHQFSFIAFGIAALIAWRLYARFRRVVSRQRLARMRPWVTAGFFTVLPLFMFLGSFEHPLNAIALAAGAVAGAALAAYGLRTTRFEVTPDGLFYTPSAHIGIALSALLAVRLAYRALQFNFASEAGDSLHEHFGRSALTLLVFSTFSGYYATYAIGLLRWRRRVRQEQPASAAPLP
jgi:hypothetical protein